MKLITKGYSRNTTRRKLVGGGLALLAGVLLGCAGKTATTASNTAPSKADILDTLLNQQNYAKLKPGNFLMGSPETEPTNKEPELRMRPQHRVLITQPFEMGKYEVTQAQWEAVMGNNPSQFKGANLPVERVSWQDTQEFMARLQPLDDKHVYRLPTEAEWEYACRAGSTGDFTGQSVEDVRRREAEYDRARARALGKTSRGKSEREKERERERGKKLGELAQQRDKDSVAEQDEEAKREDFYNSPLYAEPLVKFAWFYGTAQGHTHTVGQREPNAWGLYDLHGNVMEWCQDWFDVAYYKTSPMADPLGQKAGTLKVNRGCSWQSPAVLCQAAMRGYDGPTDRAATLGFRLVRVTK